MNLIESFNSIDIAIDADAESANEYNDEIEERIYCRWLRHGYDTDETMNQFAELVVRRRLMQKRDAQSIIDFAVELKDEGLKTGDTVQLSTDEMCDIYGNDIASEDYYVTKREPKGSTIKYRALRMPQKKICFIAPTSHPDYDSATAAEKEYGYIAETDGDMDAINQGYHIY